MESVSRLKRQAWVQPRTKGYKILMTEAARPVCFLLATRQHYIAFLKYFIHHKYFQTKQQEHNHAEIIKFDLLRVRSEPREGLGRRI